MNIPGFTPTTLSNEEITIELTRCDRCQTGIPKFIVVYHNPNHSGILTLCAICYSDYVDEKAKLIDTKPKEQEVMEEVVGVRVINEEEQQASTTQKLVKDITETKTIEDTEDRVEEEKKEETETETELAPENWFQIFLKKLLHGETPLDVLKKLGVLEPGRINETIITLQTVASYPFPSVREKTVELLIHFYKNPPTKEAKNLAKASLMVFQNDTDPRVKELLKEVL